MISVKKRNLLFFITIISIISLMYAFYAEYYLGEIPCPLCIAQRFIIGIIGVFALIAAIQNPKGYALNIYLAIIMVFSLLGIKTAAHHLWLMHLPLEQQPTSCSMPLEILFKKIPLGSFVRHVLAGDAECVQITWKILGLSAPTAVIVLYSIIILMTLYIFFSKSK